MTRFVRLYAVRNTSSKNVLKSLMSFTEEFGLPDRIISDRGSCFTSKEFQNFCKEKGFLDTLNSTTHPQGNGMAERSNRTILSTIVTSMKSKDQKDWYKSIKEVERNLNNTINKTIGKAPFEILHGYIPRFQDGVLRLLADEEAEVRKEKEKLQKEAREMIVREQEKMKTYYDKQKSGSLSFEQGKIVVVKKNSKSTPGEPTKTQPSIGQGCYRSTSG
ncbi:uncharacterized protein LOC118184241 [Stegodyphus dumicola]|uniref:uncharacterized protein LOC118184241 n=1 Tax=Stegodyphus dumicola TaxID=202533 RepID=UPI0015AD60E6|nr:uncharacterized protein LOC118184241 [Stegodyphus dumicola]